MRTTRQVIDDHLELAREGEVETDLARNYAPDVLVFISDGIHRGHDGVRDLADRLMGEIPDARFIYVTVQVEEEFAFLEWTAESRDAIVMDGADSFVIRDGLIVAQTIHYTVEAVNRI